MRAAILALVLALALLGCGSGEPEFSDEQQVPAADRTEDAAAPADADDDEQVLVFVADDIFYDDPPTTARAGTLTIVLDNVGAAEHNIVFEGFNDEEPVAEAPGGEQDEGTITLDEPGEYVYYCSIPGHRAAGMEGVLTVSS